MEGGGDKRGPDSRKDKGLKFYREWGMTRTVAGLGDGDQERGSASGLLSELPGHIWTLTGDRHQACGHSCRTELPILASFCLFVCFPYCLCP